MKIFTRSYRTTQLMKKKKISTEIDILVCEVGLRDGLQNAKGVMPTHIKKLWISSQVKAGFREMEVCSFVPPDVIKGMEDAAEIVAYASQFQTLTVGALAPNFRGAKDAIDAGAKKVSLPVSVSEAHSQSNVKKSRSEMIGEVYKVCKYRDGRPSQGLLKIEVGLSTSFGCMIQGEIPEREVIETARSCIESGVDEVVLSDTAGMANPSKVKRLFTLVKMEIGKAISGVHLHNTNGLGLVNALAAIEAGATALDSSLGGLGGCPFASGATGNIVTEDLVYLLEAEGLRTGVDLGKLLKCRAIVKKGLPDDELYGYWAQMLEKKL